MDDIILVKVLEIDEKGRLNLSRREALIEVEGLKPEMSFRPGARMLLRETGTEEAEGAAITAAIGIIDSVKPVSIFKIGKQGQQPVKAAGLVLFYRGIYAVNH